RYPPAAMGKTLVIAEKPSVGRDLASVLPGAFAKHDGYLEAPEYVVSWAVGHLVQLAEPDEYDPKYKKWRMADLPIVPERFRLVIRDERSKKQMAVISRQLKRDDVDAVVNACDAGREGELIFAYLYEKAGARKGRGLQRPDGRDHQARQDDAEAAAAPPVRPHLATARSQLALRLLGPPHARGRPAPVRGAHGADLSTHELALSDRRHGRRDQ